MVIFFILLVFYTLLLFLIMAGFIYIELHKYSSEHIVNNYRPKTLVIMPVKGVDYSIEKNLTSIKNQKYQNFKLLCVVDSEEEEALSVIKKLRIDYIISSYRCKKCSGIISNKVFQYAYFIFIELQFVKFGCKQFPKYFVLAFFENINHKAL